jgi:hypothetical protein
MVVMILPKRSVMLKVQTYAAGIGWVHATRAGELPAAWSALAGYRKRWPSEQHRLVGVADDGAITVIPDDKGMLSLFDGADAPQITG